METVSFIIYATAALATVGIMTAGTAYALSRSLKRHDDVDSLFWYGFSGTLAVVSAIVAAAVIIPGSGGIVSAGALVCAGLAGGWLWRGEHDRSAKLRDEARRREREAVRARHERVLQQWVTYELDPAAAIDFPAMTDLSRSDTSHLIRSMRSAALRRERLDASATIAGASKDSATKNSATNDTASHDTVEQDAAEYAAAVGRLEAALTAAETAAGVVRVDPPGSADLPRGSRTD